MKKETAIKKTQVGTNLRTFSTKNLVVKKDGTAEMSIYAGNGELTKECITQQMAKIKQAFPNLTPQFLSILLDRILENETMTDRKLTDAVNNVIDTFEYPNPTVAKFLNYDKKVELLTYDKVVAMAQPKSNIFDTYKAIDVGLSMPMYAYISDIEQYNLKLWKTKKS